MSEIDFDYNTVVGYSNKISSAASKFEIKSSCAINSDKTNLTINSKSIEAASKGESSIGLMGTLLSSQAKHITTIAGNLESADSKNSRRFTYRGVK